MVRQLASNAWFVPFLAALLVTALALLVHHASGPVLERMTRLMPVLHATLLNIQRPAKAVLPLGALLALWQALPQELSYLGNVRHLNGICLIAAATWLVIRAVSGFADGTIKQHAADIRENLESRRLFTQARVLARTANSVLLVVGAAFILMTFPGAREVGASLLASAGLVGIVAGFAARPVLSNFIAGLQIALAQPIRIDDVLLVEGEWGRVEEINGTCVVLRIWDDRRLILPLTYFVERPFQNWTRHDSRLLGSVFVFADYAMPLAPLRAEVERIVKAAPEWDGRFFNLRVTDATERAMQIRVLCTAASSALAFDLRCTVREGLIDFMQREYPQYLPRLRTNSDAAKALEQI
ncbi:mechanosensitive ion channel family protein [Variovorax sp. GT1P44]|uniref:mechanosensitive ion channel family protein n=1 Tax=Variovorax sp. GT1P44 TaxID=3443742 RepID=UPI003F44F4BB